MYTTRPIAAGDLGQNFPNITSGDRTMRAIHTRFPSRFKLHALSEYAAYINSLAHSSIGTPSPNPTSNTFYNKKGRRGDTESVVDAVG